MTTPPDDQPFTASRPSRRPRWNGKMTSKRWQPRGACANCEQWVDKIGALLA